MEIVEPINARIRAEFVEKLPVILAAARLSNSQALSHGFRRCLKPEAVGVNAALARLLTEPFICYFVPGFSVDKVGGFQEFCRLVQEVWHEI